MALCEIMLGILTLKIREASDSKPLTLLAPLSSGLPLAEEDAKLVQILRRTSVYHSSESSTCLLTPRKTTNKQNICPVVKWNSCKTNHEKTESSVQQMEPNRLELFRSNLECPSAVHELQHLWRYPTRVCRSFAGATGGNVVQFLIPLRETSSKFRPTSPPPRPMGRGKSQTTTRTCCLEFGRGDGAISRLIQEIKDELRLKTRECVLALRLHVGPLQQQLSMDIYVYTHISVCTYKNTYTYVYV